MIGGKPLVESRTEATAIARATVGQLWGDPTITIDPKRTREYPFGWVFFYNTARFLETQDFRDGMIGNAPIIVDRRDGSAHVTGTARPVDAYIAQYSKHRTTSLNLGATEPTGLA